MLLRNLFESLERTGQGKSAVVGWGRGMGHKGHMFLASSVITQAKEANADPYFVVSKTVGKDDPINPDEKLAIYKKVFPQSGHIFQTATDEMPDLTRVLTKLNQMDYTDVTIVVGADQVKGLSYVKQYNGKPDKAGNILFSFNTLNVISRQETNDPSRDQEGPRATPMRAVLMDPAKSEEEKFAVWRDAMNPELSDEEVMDLMHKAQQRMQALVKPKKGLKEFAPGSGGGESGRWYTDDQMTDIVGDGWWNDLDVSGNISKQEMIEQAQAWLDDQGYSVQVLNCRLNDDDMDWFIEGSFHNPGFAKKGVAEFAMSGGDDEEDPFDNYPCYDCGSTIFLHHTKLCELAEDNAIRDLPSKPGSQHWTGEVPKGLHTIPGLKEADSPAMSHMAKSLENPPKVMQHRAKRDQERERQWMGSQIAKNDKTSKDEWGDLKQEDAAGVGVIASKKQAKDPRYSMSLTKDVRPGQVEKGLKAFNLAELSSEKLGQYKKAAGAQATAADKAGDTKKADKRFSGIVKATKKQFANDEKAEGVAVEPDPTGYQKDLLTTPKNSLVIDTPGDLDWYKLGQHYPSLGTDDPHEYGQGDSDMMIVPYSKKELVGLKQKLDRLKMRYKDIGGGHEQPEIHDRVEEKMMPASMFAGSKKNKLGPAGQLKGSMKRPARAGDLVGGDMEEEKQRLDPRCWKGYRKQGTKMKGGVRVNNCVPVSEDVENIMDVLINKIIVNEAIQNNKR